MLQYFHRYIYLTFKLQQIDEKETSTANFAESLQRGDFYQFHVFKFNVFRYLQTRWQFISNDFSIFLNIFEYICEYFSISTDTVGSRNYLHSICVRFIEFAVALSKTNLPLQGNKDSYVT